MGMYDEIHVQYPLPDGWHTQRVFQTKDLDCELETYVLRADGRLLHAHTGADQHYHGALTFSTSNVTASGPEGYCTDDGEDAWFAEYVALYDHGTLVKLEGAKRVREAWRRRPRLTRTQWEAAVQAAWERREQQRQQRERARDG